jgi:hypothetical protein
VRAKYVQAKVYNSQTGILLDDIRVWGQMTKTAWPHDKFEHDLIPAFPTRIAAPHLPPQREKNSKTGWMNLPNPIKASAFDQYLLIRPDLTVYNLAGKLVDRGSANQSGIFLVGSKGKNILEKVVVLK